MSDKPSHNEAGPHRRTTSVGLGIRADELIPMYSLSERLGWGYHTIIRAQKDGLRVLRYAKWKYVYGADLIEFLGRMQSTTKEQASAQGSDLSRVGQGPNGKVCRNCCQTP